MMSLWEVIFRKNGPSVRSGVNPKIGETYERIREEVHSITGTAHRTHAAVEQKHRSVRAAEAALRALHGDEDDRHRA